MQGHDINTQIDRILSSNIRDELLNHIPLQMLQSPAIQKKYVRDEMSSAKSKQSFSRQNFQQDLYEKAQQIMKLKQTLQAELSNINQIVEDNQKLTEANLSLNEELRKIKAEFKTFKLNANNQLNREKQKSNQMQTQMKQSYLLANKKNHTKNHKMSIISAFAFQNQNGSSFIKEKRKNNKLQISSQIFVQKVNFLKLYKYQISSQTDFTQQTFDDQVESLKNKVQKLTKQNNRIKAQIQSLRQSQTKTQIKEQKKNQENEIKYRNAVECYSSVFLKSVFSEAQNSEQIIRAALFSQQKPFFLQLQEAKYFGKMVLGKKNGSGFQEYKNGFRYQGNFSNDQRHGIGKLIYKHKLVYMGEWKKGKFYGKGTLFYFMNLKIQKIQGNFKNGWLEGYSTISFHSGHKIRAIFKKNKILQDGMFLPNQKDFPKSFTKKYFQGKLQFNRTTENENNIIFITCAGQVIDL